MIASTQVAHVHMFLWGFQDGRCVEVPLRTYLRNESTGTYAIVANENPISLGPFP